MLADETIPVGEVARRLRVSPATLYRHMPSARSTVQNDLAGQAAKKQNIQTTRPHADDR